MVQTSFFSGGPSCFRPTLSPDFVQPNLLVKLAQLGLDILMACTTFMETVCRESTRDLQSDVVSVAE